MFIDLVNREYSSVLGHIFIHRLTDLQILADDAESAQNRTTGRSATTASSLNRAPSSTRLPTSAAHTPIPRQIPPPQRRGARPCIAQPTGDPVLPGYPFRRPSDGSLHRRCAGGSRPPPQEAGGQNRASSGLAPARGCDCRRRRILSRRQRAVTMPRDRPSPVASAGTARRLSRTLGRSLGRWAGQSASLARAAPRCSPRRATARRR
jgi:hypothetical protein